jgi:hypothetical protein
MQYSADGISYRQAIKLIDELKKLNIQANITAGGICISVSETEINLAGSICRKYNASFSPGATQHQDNTNITNNTK